MFVGQQVLLINGGREVSFDAQKTEKRCHPDTPMRPNCPRFEKSSYPLYSRCLGKCWPFHRLYELCYNRGVVKYIRLFVGSAGRACIKQDGLAVRDAYSTPQIVVCFCAHLTRGGRATIIARVSGIA